MSLIQLNNITRLMVEDFAHSYTQLAENPKEKTDSSNNGLGVSCIALFYRDFWQNEIPIIKN